MSLITITGYPASGKSSRARQLKAFLQEKASGSKDVILLSEMSHSLDIKRSAYDNSAAEKPARGALLTAIIRLLSPNNILIVDAPNYIKGFRYQIYCAAREMKVRVATVYVLTPQEQCRNWNKLREGDDKYSDETLENLFLRYEEPSSMVRWDSPLFTLLWSDESISQSTLNAIWDAVEKGKVNNPNSGTVATAKAPTDALAVLEKTTLSIMQQILSSQNGFGGVVTLSHTSPVSGSTRLKLILPSRNVTLPELSRLKRQFVTAQKKAITLGTIERGSVDWSEEGVGERFVVFLGEQFHR
ncbi:chromatin associated protein KTI12 [Lentinula edodes]|uniref:chromatin associated protein KTI12 n=1 Tax=Lentinula edodes TaxID=5353 RepID=UPI001E8CC50E|nr:chromatin associated protein KTI12 [Lentinula edodes]KAH7875251.1 chromatin associated protein KTI12 [Lentinula edodes]